MVHIPVKLRSCQKIFIVHRSNSIASNAFNRNSQLCGDYSNLKGLAHVADWLNLTQSIYVLLQFIPERTTPVYTLVQLFISFSDNLAVKI